jgi:hypothetical protein
MNYNPNEPRDDDGRWTDGFVAENPDKWFKDNKGTLIGNGECVTAVVNAIPSIGLTKDWIPGVAISEKEQPKLAKGTAIATFELDEKKKRLVYRGHAAIFVKYDEQDGRKGIVVWEQWAKRFDKKGKMTRPDQPPQERFIPFDPKKGKQNNAGAYSVVTKKPEAPK